MIAFYAMGGGWGHLTRIKTYIKNAGIHAPFRVITSHQSAPLFFDSQSIIHIPATEKSTKADVTRLLAIALESFHFDACYIDVFPSGILGELTKDSISSDRFHYLGRRLIWDTYRALIHKPIEFETSFLFEELEEPHFKFIRDHSKQIEKVELSYPSPDEGFTHPLLEKDQSIWLVVHTSNAEEASLLLNHARDIASIEQAKPLFVVLSSEELDEKDAHCLTQQNPIDWYPKAERIFSACGFNSWHELAPWRVKHVYLPLKRKFDDQFWRSNAAQEKQ